MSVKACEHCIVHGCLDFNLARSRRGAARVGNLGMNLRKYPARPRKDRMCVTEDCRVRFRPGLENLNLVGVWFDCVCELGELGELGEQHVENYVTG